MLGFNILFASLLFSSAQAQNQQPRKPPVPFGAAPQTSQLQQENFPQQLLEELEAIKIAALGPSD
jgi:hypothetical protein